MPRKKVSDDSQVGTRAEMLPVLRELREIAKELQANDGDSAADILGVLKKAANEKLPVVDQRECARKLFGLWEDLFGERGGDPVQMTPKRSLCQEAYERRDFERGRKLDCLRWVLWGVLQTVREPGEGWGHEEQLPMGRRIELAKGAVRLARHYAELWRGLVLAGGPKL